MVISSADLIDALGLAYPNQAIDTSVVYHLTTDEKLDLYNFVSTLPLDVAPIDIAALLSTIFC